MCCYDLHLATPNIFSKFPKALTSAIKQRLLSSRLKSYGTMRDSENKTNETSTGQGVVA